MPLENFKVHIETSVCLRWILTGIRNEEACMYTLRFDYLYFGFCPQCIQGWWRWQESLWRNEEKAVFWDGDSCLHCVSPGNQALSDPQFANLWNGDGHLPGNTSQVDMNMRRGRTNGIFCKNKCNINVQMPFMRMVTTKAPFQRWQWSSCSWVHVKGRDSWSNHRIQIWIWIQSWIWNATYTGLKR